jgi:hypothetical protein
MMRMMRGARTAGMIMGDGGNSGYNAEDENCKDY